MEDKILIVGCTDDKLLERVAKTLCYMGGREGGKFVVTTALGSPHSFNSATVISLTGYDTILWDDLCYVEESGEDTTPPNIKEKNCYKWWEVQRNSYKRGGKK